MDNSNGMPDRKQIPDLKNLATVFQKPTNMLPPDSLPPPEITTESITVTSASGNRQISHFVTAQSHGSEKKKKETYTGEKMPPSKDHNAKNTYGRSFSQSGMSLNATVYHQATNLLPPTPPMSPTGVAPAGFSASGRPGGYNSWSRQNSQNGGKY